MAYSRRGSHLERGFMTSGRRGSHVEEIVADPSTLTFTDKAIRRASNHNPDFGGLQADSKDATDAETTMSLWQAIKLYRKAIGWSVLLSTTVVMDGYDKLLLANLFASSEFNAKYGNQTDRNGARIISASWRSALANGALVGEILGLWLTGIVQERYGFKKTIGGALVAMTGFIFVLFFAVDIGMLLAGEILCGLAWGVFQVMGTAYASEVTPVVLRGYLTAYTNMCWVFGQLVASGVLRAMVNRNDQWSYRIPFALQWMWPLPILVGCILCPESPWWLVRKGRFQEARTSLLRLTSANNASFDVDKTIAMIEHTTELETALHEGTSYRHCFQGTNLRRTEVTCATWLTQTLCGATFMGYSTVFYEAAGLSKANAANLTLVQFSLGAIGTICSWFLATHLGRRTLYFTGSVVLCALLLVIGFCGLAQGITAAQWAIGTMLLIYTFIYNCTIGPTCYSLITELPSTKLKAKTIVLARNAFNIFSIVAAVLTNYMLTSTSWNWGAYSGFFWAGTCFLCGMWIFFRLPEPKGRTYGELDILFENRVSARKFKGTKVDVFRGETIAVLPADSDSQRSGSAHETVLPNEKLQSQMHLYRIK